MFVFILFIAMLLIIALSVWTGITALANLVTLAGLTGLVFMYLHNPDNTEGKLNQWIMALSAQQKKQWYGLFAVSVFFGLLFGNLWYTTMGGQ